MRDPEHTEKLLKEAISKSLDLSLPRNVRLHWFNYARRIHSARHPETVLRLERRIWTNIVGVS